MNGNMKSKNIAIIGSGIVGQATGKGLIKAGHKVIFYDINPQIINSLREDGFKADHIKDLGKQKINTEFYLISVPTPTNEGHIELRYLEMALENLGKSMRKNKNFPIFVVRSTVPPGTTENLAVATLEKFSGKKNKKDFGICMNPEFLREVSAENDFINPWMVVIGSDDKESAKKLEKIYSNLKCPIVHVSLKEAEMMKYAHNLLNATKISFFNEMRLVGKKIDVDPEAIFPIVVKSAEAIWNPEYGIKNFGPYSGVCLPKDTEAFFTWTLETVHFEMPVLKGTIEVNKIMKENATLDFKDEHHHVNYHVVPKFSKKSLKEGLVNTGGKKNNGEKKLPL